MARCWMMLSHCTWGYVSIYSTEGIHCQMKLPIGPNLHKFFLQTQWKQWYTRNYDYGTKRECGRADEEPLTERAPSIPNARVLLWSSDHSTAGETFYLLLGLPLRRRGFCVAPFRPEKRRKLACNAKGNVLCKYQTVNGSIDWKQCFNLPFSEPLRLSNYRVMMTRATLTWLNPTECSGSYQ